MLEKQFYMGNVWIEQSNFVESLTFTHVKQVENNSTIT